MAGMNFKTGISQMKREIGSLQSLTKKPKRGSWKRTSEPALNQDVDVSFESLHNGKERSHNGSDYFHRPASTRSQSTLYSQSIQEEEPESHFEHSTYDGVPNGIVADASTPHGSRLSVVSQDSDGSLSLDMRPTRKNTKLTHQTSSDADTESAGLSSLIAREEQNYKHSSNGMPNKELSLPRGTSSAINLEKNADGKYDGPYDKVHPRTNRRALGKPLPTHHSSQIDSVRSSATFSDPEIEDRMGDEGVEHAKITPQGVQEALERRQLSKSGYVSSTTSSDSDRVKKSAAAKLSVSDGSSETENSSLKATKTTQVPVGKELTENSDRRHSVQLPQSSHSAEDELLEDQVVPSTPFQRSAMLRQSMTSYASSATFTEEELAQRLRDEEMLDAEIHGRYHAGRPRSRTVSRLSSDHTDAKPQEITVAQAQVINDAHTEEDDALSLELDSDLDSTESESEYVAWKEKQEKKKADRRAQDLEREGILPPNRAERPVRVALSDSTVVYNDDEEEGELHVQNQLMLDDNELARWDEELDEEERRPAEGMDDIVINVETKREPRMKDASYYFDDGHRVIDFILAYQPKMELKDKDVLRKEMSNRMYRKAFEDKLEELGLQLEREGLEKSQDGKTCFVKIHASWEFLCRQAELQQIKVPLAPLDVSAKRNKRGLTEKSIQRCCKGINPFRLPDNVVPELDLSYKARFDSSRLGMFMINSKDTFFTPTQRIRMVYDTVQRLTVMPIKKKKNKRKQKKERVDDSTPISFFWLRQEKIYTAAYPIHDSECKYPDNNNPYVGVDPKLVPQRYWLYSYWGDFTKWKMYQPLDEIADYFGVRVGLYFAWLGFYTRLLYVPAFVGLLCLIYGIVSVAFDPVVQGYCNATGWGNVTTCRLCPDTTCQYNQLKSTCAYTKISHVFDNYATVFFAVFISIWAIVFLEKWKRRQSELASRWDAADQEFNDVVLRAQYQLTVKNMRVNPITQVEEPFLDDAIKNRRLIASVVSVVFFILLVLAFMAALIIYRIISVALWARLNNNFIKELSPSLVTSITASLVNAVTIFVLTLLYRKAAWALTEYEYPRTEEDFEVSYTYKVFMFQFMNYYGSLFYLALFKGKFQDSMNDMDQYSDQCGYSGCMAEVCIQLIIIMTGKQILNNIFEAGMPIMHNYFRMRNVQKESEENEFSRWERDYVLNDCPTPGQFEDYLEMIIQYGFLVMFAAAFPLAAVFALLNNIIEIRIDANKQLTEYRRPMPERVPNIGPWFTILELTTKLAVITNALVIAFTSDFIDRAVYAVFYKHGPIDGDGYLNQTFTTFNPADMYPKLVHNNSELANNLMRWNTSDNTSTVVTECFYKGYYGRAEAGIAAYQRTKTWWHVMAARLAFVIMFEHVIFFVQAIIQNCIPDVPEHVTLKMERERYVTKQHFMKHELGEEKYNKVFKNEGEDAVEEQSVGPEAEQIEEVPRKRTVFGLPFGRKKTVVYPVEGATANSFNASIANGSISHDAANKGHSPGKTISKVKQGPWFVVLFKKWAMFC